MRETLWIISELFPPDETSTSYIMGEIANAFADKYKVKVICGPEIYDKRKKPDGNSRFHLDPSIELLRVRGANLDKNTALGKALSFVLMSGRLHALAKANIHREDKVLMVTNPAPLVLLINRLKKKVGFSLHILVHDVFPENTGPAGVKLPFYRQVKRAFDKAYSRADQIIALGRDMAEVLEGKVKNNTGSGNPAPEIRVIENWADVEGIHPQAFPDGKFILQYAGNIGRVQGLEKVIGQLPDGVEFHLYGTGSMESRLKAMNHPGVFFHGPYFRSQQNEVLSACHLALVTLEDGMYGLGVPSKTYNILSSGRPVMFLGPKDSEIDRLVREEGIGYCGWPEKWDRKELSEMGLKARELAEKRYAKDKILKRFLEAI